MKNTRQRLIVSQLCRWMCFLFIAPLFLWVACLPIGPSQEQTGDASVSDGLPESKVSGSVLEIENQTLLSGKTKAIKVKLLKVEQSSRLLIFTDKAGKPDKILGKAFRSKGERRDFIVTLSESLKNSQTLHAIVYDGSAAWNPSTPKTKDKDGNDLQVTFEVTIRSATQGATLQIEDQVLEGNFRNILVKKVSLPVGYKISAVLQFYKDDKGQKGKEIGTGQIKPGQTQRDITIPLNQDILGSQLLHATLLSGGGQPFTDENGDPLTLTFQVQGDVSVPALVIDSQTLPANDLKAVSVTFVSVPKHKRVGWVAMYEDDAGKPGKLLQKQSFQAGEHRDVSVHFTNELKKGQILHAALHEGHIGSGGWSSKNPVMIGSSGEMRVTFRVTSPAFDPVLEIPDQVLTSTSLITTGKIIVPPSYFFALVAIYEDDAGQRGKYLGHLQFRSGTTTKKKIRLNTPQQGKKTLHAAMHMGQSWNGKNPIMKDEEGKEATISFQIGAADLNYLRTPDTVSVKPTVVVVERAVSHKEYGWVVLARDNNGQPGEILGKKRVLPNFAGRVYITLDSDGRPHDYLRGNGFRKYIKGEENLHVLFYADKPQDNKFTFKPGGSEDQPLLDANGQPVTARLKVKVQGSLKNSQADSPYFYKQCTLSQFLSKPSALPVDCRCNRNDAGEFPTCILVARAKAHGFTFGKGPKVAPLNIGRFVAGFTNKSTKELISVAKWLDIKTRPENGIAVHVGVVMGIDVKTGDRRIISGRYADPKKGTYDIGKGPILSYPFEIQKGPNGKFYVASYGYTRHTSSLVGTVDIIRVDPKTGDRTYVWRSNHLGSTWDANKSPYGHCPNGRTSTKFGKQSVQFGRKAFAMDPQGNFYLSYAHNGYTDYSDGIGIAKISADGKTCTIVTSNKVGKNNHVYKGKNVGTGPGPQAGPYHGMLYKDGFLYASIIIGEQLYKIDVATGNREVIYTKSGSGQVFGSTATHIRWDPYRKLIWQDGLSSQVLLFDPATKTGAPLGCALNNRNFHGIRCAVFGTPWQTNPALEHGFWFHPTDPDIVFFSRLYGIVRYELSTGNNYIFSL